MSKVAVTKDKLDYLANAISLKSGESLTLTIDEMISAVDGIETGGSTPNLQAKTYTVDSAGTETIQADEGYDGLSEVEVDVPTASFFTGADAGFITQSGVLKWRYRGYTELDLDEGDTEGWISAGNHYGDYIVHGAVASGTTITPTTSPQTIGGVNYMMQDAVTVSAMPTGTAGTPTATKGVVSSHSVSVTPSVTNTTGYIAGSTINGTPVTVSASELVSGTYNVTSSGTKDVTNYASASVPAGTEGTPTATKGAVSSHSISVTPSVTNTNGFIEGTTKTGTAVTVSASELVSGTYTVSASGTADVTNYASISVPSLTLPQYMENSSSGTFINGLQGTTTVKYLNIPAGYNNTARYYQISAAAGSAGTPTATKGAVSDHSVTVTPSVTNTTGYITGSTKTGTAVTVSASELVSGTLSVSTNGQQDVTNYQYVDVNVSGGGGTVTVGTSTKTLSASASSISFTGLSGNPTSFVVTSSADIATNTNGVTGIVYDGTNLHGQTITTQVTADTGFTKSYSSGTLTITATTASFQANEYKLVYTYDGSSSDIHTSDVQVGSGATSITFSSLSGKPAYWSCIFKSDFSTSSGYQRVIEVVNDGTNTYGMAMDSSAKAQTSWTASYSGGSLTITSSGTNNGGYFHQPGYYQLTYAVDPNALNLQEKTGIGASTSSQTITADVGYDGLESVQINPVSQTNLTAANIKSGTTISISNGLTNLWSVTGTYSGGGGSASIDTKTVTASNRPSSLSFTSMKGEPIAWFLKATFTMTSSSSTYYYVDSMRYNGSDVTGRLFRMGSTRQTENVTTGYSYTYSGTTLTVTSSGNRTTSPGCFYNGSYELVYVY